ncbi:MAG: restriction endonuclease subunit M [Bacteroidaceae bacterium]|nr:restriction endonuclease subunit M [Bacteroidaceae bacterium]
MTNDNENIDILEEVINAYDPEVMERLLWDHSRPTENKLISDLNVDGHHHIYWATDNYETEGKGFCFFDEIQIASVTGKYNTLVRPRCVKSKEEQEQRTREKAEVFTPSWVCNAQNNLVDEAWFGMPNVFNTEHPDTHTWIPREEHIPFPTKDGKTWQDYVWDKRLEMACGEAPYLVSRYDTTTGEPITELKMRIGLLDRKLRVINENVDNNGDWLFWAKCAVKSIYGFEWQGDNLLLAREAVLYSVIDYYKDFTENVLHKKQSLSIATLRTLAYIISWNIFQMDGILFTLPMSGCKQDLAIKQQTVSLFDAFDEPTEKVDISPIERKKVYASVAEWSKDNIKDRKPHLFKDIK